MVARNLDGNRNEYSSWAAVHADDAHEGDKVQWVCDWTFVPGKQPNTWRI